MGKQIGIILVLLLSMVGVSEAQVTPGTVNSKMLDGNGNKITSTVTGPSRGIDVNVLAGGGGGSAVAGVAFLSADGIANQTLNAIHGFGYMYNGVTWDRIRGSIAGGLEVNCITGCAGGSSTPTDAFANPTTAGIQQTFNMGFNGATWDRLRSTIAGGLLVNVSNASLAVTGTFFQATQPISAVALPLPTGASTSALQTTGNTSLSNIDTDIDVALSTRASEATLSTRLADSTFTGRFIAATLDADAIANETTTSIHGKCYLYNGTTWDRCRGAIATGMLVSISNASIAVTGTVAVSNSFLLDATLTNRFPTGSTPADNESNAVTISRIGNFNYIFDGAAWDRWTGAVTQSGTWNIGTVTAVTSITNTVTVQGAKTNNNAAPGATNVGVLPCIATAAVPAYTEGNQVGCSTNLSGAQRVIEQNFVSVANNDGACPSGAVSFTAIASNASRTWLAVWASPANTDDVYLKLGATATAADARFAPGQPLNFTSGRIYTGIIDAFPASGTQAVCVMELN